MPKVRNCSLVDAPYSSTIGTMPTVHLQPMSGRNRCGTITLRKKPEPAARPTTVHGLAAIPSSARMGVPP